MSKYNVYDSFLYKNKKFILAFSYTPGFNIDFIIDDISKNFNLYVVRLDGPDYLNSESKSKFDFNKLNNKVGEILEESQHRLNSSVHGYFGQGILIYGLYLPNNLLKFNVDLHLHFSLNLTNFITLNPKYNGDDYKKFNEILSDNKIQKYYNVKTNPTIELNDQIFDKIIDFIELKVYGPNYSLYSTKLKNEQKIGSISSESSNNTKSDSDSSTSSNSSSSTKLSSSEYESDSNSSSSTKTDSDTDSDLDIDSDDLDSD